MKCQNKECRAPDHIKYGKLAYFRKKRICQNCWGKFRFSPNDYIEEIEAMVTNKKMKKPKPKQSGLFKDWGRK